MQIKVGLVIAGTVGKLHDHMCLNLGAFTPYRALREMIINYVKSKLVAHSLHGNNHKGVAPMEVDGLSHTHKKGKGKGNNKGSTGTTGKKYCSKCKTTTHNTNDCWFKDIVKINSSKPTSGNTKGKSKGKGKRKGVRALENENEVVSEDYDDDVESGLSANALYKGDVVG